MKNDAIATVQPETWAAIALMLWSAADPAQSDAQTLVTLSAQQVDKGETAYQRSCARCHGAFLGSGGSAPPLLTEVFVQHWAGRPIADLFSYMKQTMPPENPGGVSDSTYSSIIAYVLDAYGVNTSAALLPSSDDSMASMLIPTKETLYANLLNGGGGGLAPGVVLPEWPVEPNPLEKMTRVRDTTLVKPPPESWPVWRRTLDAGGFSPLNQIDTNNVADLEVAWTLSLPPGPNSGTPLVHDGVMFVRSYGDHLQALNAATGEELWHYQSEGKGIAGGKKHIALYDDKVYLTTTDSRVIALTSKTVRLAWEWSGRDLGLGVLSGGGPIVVEGVVMQGASTTAYAGSIVGLDASSGKLLWQFHNIAQPGQPNGDSWNGLPVEKRTGGQAWMGGSYDAKRGLVLIGPSATYDTQPLRNLVDAPGVTNAALFTNSTIALMPRTGELAWYYQHFPNDQWDLDWAFERQIIDLNFRGKNRRIILTGGKPAIFDALDADTGQYVFSFDLGLQNLVTGIDSQSGAKQIDRSLTPGMKDAVTVCPHVNGGRSWLASAYDHENRMLFVPLVESCMDMVRVKRRGTLGGIRWTLRPRRGSDGKYGRLQAINVETQKTAWIKRQRAPQTSCVLATAGGTVFAGALDRWFTAYNAKTGDELWKMRLSDVPNSCPITYSVKGHQYIAIVTSHGGVQSVAFLPLVPEIKLPAGPSSVLWVFKLRDGVK